MGRNTSGQSDETESAASCTDEDHSHTANEPSSNLTLHDVGKPVEDSVLESLAKPSGQDQTVC